MRLRRGRATLALLLVACAVAAGGVIAALITTKHGHETTGARAPTTGMWAPLTVPRPKVPVIAGGIPVDIDPMTVPTYFTTTLTPLTGTHRYRMSIFNVSNLGAINAFQWYPPVGVHVVKLIGSSAGHCAVTGLEGFGGNQFPTVVLNQNISCTGLDLKAPSCTCLGDGGTVTLSFATDKDIAVGEGDLRMRSATVSFDRIPGYVKPHSSSAPLVKRVATANVDSGGLTARERAAAQSAMDALQNSNIPLQLVTISRWVQGVPATCRVRLVSQNPSRYQVYLFWVPWLAAEPYVWLNMNITGDLRTSTAHLGTAQPVLPGGRLKPNGQTINRLSVDTTLLSLYGPQQAKKGRELMAAHGGGVFAKPGATCQVLKNGNLRLLPAT
ncbi:MAG TPA: hypothetical protein VMB53_12145 [Gaiellaceae bacterium]|nr:hypothetical protein [Gaiellaceae bacterium]